MLSDDELVEQILLGNENAAEELIKRYYTSILRYCRWHCSNLEKAEDLTQETFLKLFKNLSGYKGKKKWVNHFSYGLAPNVLGYRHPAAILDRSKNKCCGLITDGEELKNNQLCFSVDTTVLHLFSDLSRTCPRTSGGWIPPLALTPKNNRSVSFLVA